MRKLFIKAAAFGLAAAMLLSGCSTNEQSKEDSPAGTIDESNPTAGTIDEEKAPAGTYKVQTSYVNIYGDGMFYESQMRLKYIDFTNMNDVFVCPYPNCTHTDPSVCAAYGITIHPTVADGSLYSFNSEITFDRNSEPVTVLSVTKSGLDGTNRENYDEVENAYMNSLSTVVTSDSAVYFANYKPQFDEMSGSTSNVYGYSLASYDLLTKEFKEYDLEVEGYGAGMSIMGVFDGEIYVLVSVSEDENVTENTSHTLYRFNPLTESVNESDIEIDMSRTIAAASDDYLVYSTPEGTYVYTKDGSSTLFEEFRPSYGPIVNGILFPSLLKNGAQAVDLSTMELIPVRLESSLINPTIVYYIDGSYVMQGIDTEQNEMVFTKVPQDEVLNN